MRLLTMHQRRKTKHIKILPQDHNSVAMWECGMERSAAMAIAMHTNTTL